ncbi:SymE family type I addiction module toxin [Xenorhabdus sp. TS4]|uniref:SymE family type I addiction module toxin n=1 Tax=Xenorhabdus sp. TS4 TaxID=1873483 RepID=UPI001656FFED|nr:SymE family type I addiction module toxin [Xenorhabdus sp. TS4]MBC8949420.1 endoribonuclease symE [Xenorhabdus sp. TS4]
MAKRDSKAKPVTTKAQATQPRHYTVGYRPNRGKPNPYPQLTIKGRWLAALGFTTGAPITITSEAGQLIIRLVENN